MLGIFYQITWHLGLTENILTGKVYISILNKHAAERQQNADRCIDT